MMLFKPRFGNAERREVPLMRLVAQDDARACLLRACLLWLLGRC